MNILHLRYAIEVEKTGSISQAAANLYMGQPNLSKAIKELETTLDITIFKRTSKGVVPTKKGQEFLNYAKNLLSQIEEMESLYKPAQANKQRFNISIPRASYITHAFVKFVIMSNQHPLANCIELNCSELRNYIEIVHGDLTIPSLPFSKAKKLQQAEQLKKHIYVYERGSQFDLLCNVPLTYMWGSPIPAQLLQRYGLVQRQCEAANRKYKDVLIYAKGYRLNKLENQFLVKLNEVRDELGVTSRNL
jgi:molybdenum-dependent DNA-binding transcriptional regulator ModE